MFIDRADAGRQLAEAVAIAAPPDPVVLALPRGGVPLGAAVADRIGAPLDLVFVSKLGLPGHSELAAGAIVDGAEPLILWNRDVLRRAGLAEADFADQIVAKRAETLRRRKLYLSGRAALALAGRTAILVDDGVATGATLRVALKAVRAQGAEQVWAAVPVAPHDMLPILEEETDRLICLEAPRDFVAVGAQYREFGQVQDAEVVRLLADAAHR
ncbi:phosphoribosyltransferase [Rhodobacterales bacterium HKCCSP123]|nr:phosphoribosyltransferase [Rhodobacterales bacterium HKCCSP123]